MIRFLLCFASLWVTAHGFCRRPLGAPHCHFRPPKEIVPADLVHGVAGGLDDNGVFEARAVFDWSHAAPGYVYKIMDRYPEDAATSETLGARAGRNLTVLARFERRPENHLDDHVLENYEHYRITVQAASECAPNTPVTHATYYINLLASYDFKQNFTSAHARITACGWITDPTLVMHPDIHYEMSINLTRNVSEHIRVRSSLHVEQDGNGTCAGLDSPLGTPCYGVLNVSIVREGFSDEPLGISYALSQFAQMTPDPQESDVRPYNFNASRHEPVPWLTDYRYDVCEGRVTSLGLDYEAKRDPTTNLSHVAMQDVVYATCRYRVFFADEVYAPFAYLMGWYDYDIGGRHNHTRLGSIHQAFTITL